MIGAPNTTADNDVSPDFQAVFQRVYASEMANPDPRVSYLLSRVPIHLQRIPTLDEYQAAGIWNPDAGTILTGLHFGSPELDPSQHAIYLFEQPMYRRAALEGVSIEQRLRDSTIHELTHVLGGCSYGHFDCTIAELQRDRELGGMLSPEQESYYRQRGMI